MDINKNKAEQYMVLAERYMRRQKYEKAERIARKAQKLYPMKKAEDLLAKVLSKQNQKPKSTKPGRSQSNSEYTEEQLEQVKRIKKCKDYYEILGVSKNATDSDIKKTYRKLALQLHPDKNKAADAAEAFKTLQKAHETLIDIKKRNQYDMDQEKQKHAHSQQGTNDATSDISLDPSIQLAINMFMKLLFYVLERN